MSTTTFGTIATRLPPQIRRVLATVFVQTQQDNEHNFGFNWHERTINSEKVIIKKSQNSNSSRKLSQSKCDT